MVSPTPLQAEYDPCVDPSNHSAEDGATAGTAAPPILDFEFWRWHFMVEGVVIGMFNVQCLGLWNQGVFICSFYDLLWSRSHIFWFPGSRSYGPAVLWSSCPSSPKVRNSREP